MKAEHLILRAAHLSRRYESIDSEVANLLRQMAEYIGQHDRRDLMVRRRRDGVVQVLESVIQEWNEADWTRATELEVMQDAMLAINALRTDAPIAWTPVRRALIKSQSRES